MNRGKALVSFGAVLVIVAIIWRGTGILVSQVWLFFLLIAVALAALWIGGKIIKDPDAEKAVEWKPAGSETEETAPSAPPQPETQREEHEYAEPHSELTTGEMMDCQHCGSSTRFGASECATCGAALDTSAIIVPPPTFASQPQPRAPSPALVEDHGSSGVIAPPPGMIAPPPAFSAPPPPPGLPTLPLSPPAPPGFLAQEAPPARFEQAPPVRQAETISAAPLVAIPLASDPAEDVDATRVSVRRRGGSPWRLVLPAGPNVVVDGAILIGRDPASHANWPDAQLLPVNDTNNSLSKTHAVIESDARGLWITDLNSTNGVVAVRADGTEIELNGSERVKVDAGWDIELGDFIIQVEKD